MFDMKRDTPVLQPGDEVALIAPASYMRNGSEWMIDRAVQILESWRLNVHVRCDTNQKKFYLAGDDTYRCNELKSVLEDKNIKAIFGTRGGYGSARLLPLLLTNINISEKFFIGFSDLTTLLLALEGRENGIHGIHGPHLATDQFLSDTTEGKSNRDRLHAILFSLEPPPAEKIDVICNGHAIAPMTGGCLSVVVTLLGTPFEPDFAGKIVFLEDVGEKPFRIDRMLTHLKMAGKFENVRGVVFGEMRACHDAANDLKEVIRDILSFGNFPVAFGMKAGHGKSNHPFRMGQIATLDAENRTVSFS